MCGIYILEHVLFSEAQHLLKPIPKIYAAQLQLSFTENDHLKKNLLQSQHFRGIHVHDV